MNVVMVRDEGAVVVDGELRKVDLEGFDPTIRVLQFDTVSGVGIVEYVATATAQVPVRDEDAERAEYDAAVSQAAGDRELEVELLNKLEPKFKMIDVPRPPEQIADLSPYKVYLERWAAAAPAPAPAPTLDELRRVATREVDGTAELVRLRYITPGSGQAGTYIEKAKQAEDFRSAGYPAASVPPMVQAEADATGATAQAACDVILATRDAWLVKGAQIERERRRGKVNIDGAADAGAVVAARDAAIAALDAL